MGFSKQEYWSEGGLGWGRHVNSRTFHFNVWQNSLQIKKKKKKKRILKWFAIPFSSGPHSVRPLHHTYHLGWPHTAWQRLIEFCQENTLVIENTLFQQHRRRLYTWTSPGGQHWNQIDYILCNQGWRSSTQSAKTRLGADCGSDHELLIAKFRLKLKKVGKTTRPFRYDLNKIPYDYTV